MDKSILINLGLENKEIEIYLHLLTSKVQSVKQIADQTLINRTTAYRYLEALEKKGLIEWVIDDRGRKAKCASLDKLTLFAKQRKNEAETLVQTLPNLINQLTLIKPVEKLETQIRYYKKISGIEQVIWNSLSSKETLRSYTNFGRRDVIDLKFEDDFEQEWTNRKLDERTITNECLLEYVKTKLVPDYRNTLKLRIIPLKKYYITNDILIYNNTIAIINLEKNNLVAVEIESEEMAKTQKSIFDIVWDVALPLPVFLKK